MRVDHRPTKPRDSSPAAARAAGLLLGAVLGAAALEGCRTETVSSASEQETEIAFADPQRVFEVRDATGLVGYVVRFVEPGERGRAFFSVRNERHQELGLIDGHGRAYRYHAHERDPEWLGAGTVQEGAARILGAGEEAELVELPASAGAHADD